MSAEGKQTAFLVDEERCIGCGLCVDACPMKILIVADGVCIMTDAVRCLECGTCMRVCPEDALSIEGMAPQASAGAVSPSGAAARASGGTTFTPILEHLTERLQAIQPVQVYTHHGIDIRGLDGFELEGEQCYYHLLQADKLEKIGVSRMNFYGSMVADVLVITPGPAYDIPYYVMDWDESDEHIFFICDLMPSDDVGRNVQQLQHYFYEPLDDLYQDYAMVPGMKPSVFHWVRAIHSPYLITGTIEKRGDNVDRIFSCAVDYLNVWLDLYQQAQPRDPESPAMQLVHERRQQIRALYKENDPGVGSLNKFLGDTMADVALSIIEP